jgi:hypothetical protein
MLLIILFAMLVKAYDNEAVIDLYPPEFYIVNYNDSINESYFINVTCNSNSTNVSCTNQKCEVERTLGFGETYIKDTDECNLDIRCPSESECAEVNNVSYKIHWRLYADEEEACVYYMNDNWTKCYPRDDDDYDYEKEFTISCPDVSETCDDTYNYKNWNPLNVTEDQWYYVCGRALENTMNSFNIATTSMSDYTKEVTLNNGILTESNRALAEENGGMKAKVEQYEQCINDKIECEDREQELKDKIDKLKQREYENKFGTFFFWLILIINILVLFGWSSWVGFNYIAGIKEPKRDRGD